MHRMKYDRQHASGKTRTLVTAIFACLLLIAGTCTANAEWIANADMSDQSEVSDRGTVQAVIRTEVEQTEYSGGVIQTAVQWLEIHVDSGTFAGKTVEARYVMTFGFSDRYRTPPLEAGDRVMLMAWEDENGETQIDVVDIVRDRTLLWLLLAFAGLLVLLGGWKGVKTVLTIGVTAGAVVFVLIPVILKGVDPILATVLVSMGVTMVCLSVIGGLNRKTLAAFIGTSGGVVSAGLLAKSVGIALRLTGIGDEESQLLLYLPRDIPFDFQGLLFAGIILGALGAAMDMATSLSASLAELREHSPGLPPRGILRAGMNIGRDIMGANANTLILASTGGSLHLLLLLVAVRVPFTDLINRDMIASEVVRALAGSIGLLLTIPITSLAAAWLSELPERGMRKESQETAEESEVQGGGGQTGIQGGADLSESSGSPDSSDQP